MSEPRMDVSHNLMVVDEAPNEYPPGFYAATKSAKIFDRFEQVWTILRFLDRALIGRT